MATPFFPTLFLLALVLDLVNLGILVWTGNTVFYEKGFYAVTWLAVPGAIEGWLWMLHRSPWVEQGPAADSRAQVARWRDALLRALRGTATVFAALMLVGILLAVALDLLGWELIALILTPLVSVLLRVWPAVLLCIPVVPLLWVLPGPPPDRATINWLMKSSVMALSMLPLLPWGSELANRPEFCLYGVWVGCVACYLVPPTPSGQVEDLLCQEALDDLRAEAGLGQQGRG